MLKGVYDQNLVNFFVDGTNGFQKLICIHFGFLIMERCNVFLRILKTSGHESKVKYMNLGCKPGTGFAIIRSYACFHGRSVQRVVLIRFFT